jgi:hypothetical protein
VVVRAHDDLVARVIRAERLALDMAKVCQAAVRWRGLVHSGIAGRPNTRALVDEVDALQREHPRWEVAVSEMGEDVAEYPLDEEG